MDNIMYFLIGVCSMLMILAHITDSLTKKRKNLLFCLAMAASMLLVSEKLFDVYNGDISIVGMIVARISKYLGYVLYPIITLIFNRYLADLLLVEGKEKKLPKLLKINKYIMDVGIILISIGIYYYFDENNVYHRLPLYPISHVVPFVCVFIQMYLIIRYRKKFRPAICVALILFTVSPLIAIVVKLFMHGIALTTTCIVGMTVVLYCISILDMNRLVKIAHKKEIDILKEQQENANLILNQSIEALASSIDAKDRYTNGHSRRVAKYSKMLAKRLGKTKEEQDEIYLIALLHDVGKIGIPDTIINKDGKLTDEEFATIKTHPAVGGEILSKIEIAPKLQIGARWHHERYDGKGYPDGLKGEKIPEIARIISVADSYDAMASKRSYRDALEQYRIRSEFQEGIGTQFDPKIARLMINIIDEDVDYSLREK